MDWLPPWSLIRDQLLTLALPAFAASALLMVIVCALTKSASIRRAGGMLALIAGLAAGNHFRELLEWWPVAHAADGEIAPWSLARGWAALLPVTAAAMLGGLFAAMLPARLWIISATLRLLAAGGIAWWLGEEMPPFSKTCTVVVLFAGTALSHEALLSAARQTLRRTSLLALALPWSAAAATVLIFAHSARFSDLAAVIATSLCGAGIVGAIFRLELSPLFAGPAACLPPLMLAGAVNTYSEVPPAAFACAAFAPCALWLLRLPPLQRMSARAPAVAAIIAVLIPCAAAVAMAVWMEDLDFGE